MDEKITFIKSFPDIFQRINVQNLPEKNYLIAAFFEKIRRENNTLHDQTYAAHCGTIILLILIIILNFTLYTAFKAISQSTLHNKKIQRRKHTDKHTDKHTKHSPRKKKPTQDNNLPHNFYRAKNILVIRSHVHEVTYCVGVNSV